MQSGHGCSQRAQLVGVTLVGRLRRQKLAEKIIFFGSSKKSGLRYEAIAVKLLRPVDIIIIIYGIYLLLLPAVSHECRSVKLM